MHSKRVRIARPPKRSAHRLSRQSPIQAAGRRDIADWLEVRRLLWPDTSPRQHRREIEQILRTPRRAVAFFSKSGGGRVNGFIEATLRTFVEGFSTSPVGYIEGWYVEKAARGKGVGRALVRKAEQWATSRGAKEMASDTEVDNLASQYAHMALGYKPVQRLVFFAKRLR